MAGLLQALVNFATEINCVDYQLLLFSVSIINSLLFSSEFILTQLFVSDVHSLCLWQITVKYD